MNSSLCKIDTAGIRSCLCCVYIISRSHLIVNRVFGNLQFLHIFHVFLGLVEERSKLQFIVPINCNSEIRLRRVKCSQASVKYARRACEIRPLGEWWKETLRVSIKLKNGQNRRFCTSTRPQGRISHAKRISHARQRIFHARSAFHLGLSQCDKPKFVFSETVYLCIFSRISAYFQTN